MVTRLKLKGIDGRAHQEWSLRLNLTQHGKTYQDQTVEGMTGYWIFHDSSGSGAWPFLVRGAIRLVNSDNERDLSLLISWMKKILGFFHLPTFLCRHEIHDFLKGQIFVLLQVCNRRYFGVATPEKIPLTNQENKKKEASSNNRSVMPLDILGCTRATMKVLESFSVLNHHISFTTNMTINSHYPNLKRYGKL